MLIAMLGTKGVPGRHGVEVVVDALLPHLANLGHQVTVYGYRSYAEPASNYKGTEIVTINGFSSKNIEMISHMGQACLDTWGRRFDILHIHSTDPCLLAWLPKARYGIVATSHGQAYLRKKWNFVAQAMSKLAERCFIRIPDATTCVSKPLVAYYQKKYGRNVDYIPNGVVLRQAPSPRFLEPWGLSPGGYVFCSAGRLDRTKGLHTLIEAYELLGTDTPLVVAGGGSGSDPGYMAQIKASAPQNVRFLGFLTGEAYFSLYANARVFVFPSEYEAMSMALLEGLSFGVPTVFSDIPENLAVAEGLGYAFKVGDAKSLAAAISRVLADYDKACDMGKQAKAKIAVRHDWGAIAAQYDRVYAALKERRFK